MTRLANKFAQGRKRFGRAILFVSNWLLLGIFASAVSAQEPLVQLGLTTYQNDFLVGEPVVVQASLTNRGAQGVRYQELSLETGLLKFSISREGGAWEDYQLEYIKDPTRLPSTLAANTSTAADLLVHYNYKTMSLAFPVPGRYVIRGVFRGVIPPGSRPLAAEVAINVLPPAGDEAEGAALFSRSETAGVIANISRDPLVFRQMEDYAAKHPQARFAAYGNYFLGLHHMQDYADKPKDVEKAERTLKKADRGGFQMRQTVLLQLGHLSWEQDNTAEASAYLNRIINEYPKTPAAGKALQLKTAIDATPVKKPKAGKPLPPKPASTVLHSQISKMMTDYFQAYRNRDLQACGAFFAESFRYNEALGKQEMTSQLSEDFAKIANLKGKFEVRLAIQKIELLEGKPLAEVLVTFLLNGQELSKPKRLSLEFVQNGDRWLLQSWKTRSLDSGR